MGSRPFSRPADWRVTPAVITEAVWAAKQFLDDIFDKCETYQELNNSRYRGTVRKLFGGDIDPEKFALARNNGVGGTFVERFLGEGWQKPTKEALSALQEDSARAQAERLRKRQEREAAFFLIRQFWGIKTV